MEKNYLILLSQNKAIKISGLILLGLLIFLFYLWCIPAIYFLNLPWLWLKTILAWLYALGVPVAFIMIKQRKYAVGGFFGLFLIIVIWFNLIPPSNNRHWQPSVAVLPKVEINGDQVSIQNIRNFDYQSPEKFTINYYDKTYDINHLQTLDLILSYWDGNTGIAHVNRLEIDDNRE